MKGMVPSAFEKEIGHKKVLDFRRNMVYFLTARNNRVSILGFRRRHLDEVLCGNQLQFKLCPVHTDGVLSRLSLDPLRRQ